MQDWVFQEDCRHCEIRKWYLKHANKKCYTKRPLIDGNKIKGIMCIEIQTSEMILGEPIFDTVEEAKKTYYWDSEWDKYENADRIKKIQVENCLRLLAEDMKRQKEKMKKLKERLTVLREKYDSLSREDRE